MHSDVAQLNAILIAEKHATARAERAEQELAVREAELREARSFTRIAEQELADVRGKLTRNGAVLDAFMRGWLEREAGNTSPGDDETEAGQWYAKGWQWRDDTLQCSALEQERDAALAMVAALEEAIAPLIDTAESYAMQTYDRSGVTRRQIEAARAALQAGAPQGEAK